MQLRKFSSDDSCFLIIGNDVCVLYFNIFFFLNYDGCAIVIDFDDLFRLINCESYDKVLSYKNFSSILQPDSKKARTLFTIQ